MTMMHEYQEPTAQEAQENLRVIRDVMERSTKYSTFSGLSGVLAGSASILGCLITRSLESQALPVIRFQIAFLVTWMCVICFAIGADYLLTKRRAALVGKHIISHLGKQMVIASAPGLGTGALLTVFLLQHNLLSSLYPVWMLCYGIAVGAVGLFSQREVSYLGIAFLLTGAFSLLVIPQFGLIMMAITFGGFHILYGVLMSRKDGW